MHRYTPIFNCHPYYKSKGIDPQRLFQQSDRAEMNLHIMRHCYEPAIKATSPVIVSEANMGKIRKFVKDKAKAKNKEFIQQFNQSRLKRETNGAVCEFAAFQFYGQESKFDFSIVADSRLREYPDFLNLGIYCDVKGAEVGMVPLVFKEDRKYVDENGNSYECPNIICMCRDSYVWLLGIATPQALHQYVDDNLVVLDSSKVPSKTGFFGVPKLHPMPKTLDELKEFCNGHKTS